MNHQRIRINLCMHGRFMVDDGGWYSYLLYEILFNVLKSNADVASFPRKTNSHMRFTLSTHHIHSHIIMAEVFYARFSDDCFKRSKIIETIYFWYFNKYNRLKCVYGCVNSQTIDVQLQKVGPKHLITSTSESSLGECLILSIFMLT